MPKANINKGDVYKTNGGTTCTVVKYNSNIDVDIMFNDKYSHTKKVALWDLRKGNVKNPYDVNVMGVGYIGHGVHKGWEGGKDTKAYSSWVGMLKRCYCEKEQLRSPSYLGCTVEESWLCFQVFAEWYYSQFGHDLGYQLDKDLLIKGNKVYSADTCCLVPREVNQLISYKYRKANTMPTGVAQRSETRFRACLNVYSKNKIIGTYDTSKEASDAYVKAKQCHVRNVAEDWIGKVDNKVYQALLVWTV
jgi:hypothetical protein